MTEPIRFDYAIGMWIVQNYGRDTFVDYHFNTKTQTYQSRRGGEGPFSPVTEDVPIFDSYDDIIWLDSVIPKPSEEELQIIWDESQLKKTNDQIDEQRREAYPDWHKFANWLYDAFKTNGVIPGMEEWFDACAAVKEEFPKTYESSQG